jgi:DNA (cytosine-5)-methyltransferase 1
VGENVFGLVNWNGGLVFEEVQTDLEVEGYEVQPFVLPAASVGAPHRRDRVWFVAHSKLCTNRLPAKGRVDMERVILEGRKWCETTNGFNVHNKDASDTDLHGRNERHREYEKQSGKRGFDALNDTFKVFDRWERFPTEPGILRGNDGIPNKLDGITFSKWRNESIKAYGNAVVPQVVYQIFKAIETYEKLYNERGI